MKKHTSTLLLLLLLLLSFLSSCEKDEPQVKKVYLQNLDNKSINALALDESGNLWVGTDSGLYKHSTSGYLSIEAGQDTKINSIAFVSNFKTLWLGTSEGLIRLNMNLGLISPESISSAKLSDPAINVVYVDPSSANWFGTATGITMNLDTLWQKEKFKKNANLSISNLPFEDIAINSIASWEGDYYFATNGRSLYRTSNWDASVNAFSGATQWKKPYNGSSLTDTMTVVFVDSRGDQWMGGKAGLQVHSGHIPTSMNTAFFDELPSPAVNCITEDPDGNIWVGTEKGIVVYNGSVWETKTDIASGLMVKAILIESSGTVWVGTPDGLLQY
ncbi:MAG: hypothetical protein H6540_02335 [Bacteroidales bacterium]|nr:hypothetical protein [Bacteroidales bacterium]